MVPALTDSKSKLSISSVSCRLPNMFTVVHLQEVTLSRSGANILALVLMSKVADPGRNERMQQMSKLHPKAPAFRGQPTILDICQRQVGIQAYLSIPAGQEKISSAAADTSNYLP